MFLFKVDGCTNYEVLSEADRAQGNTMYLRVEEKLKTGWYRFQGAAGNRMPDKCVLRWRCGSEHPGWLNGTHPTVAEGVVERRVCFSEQKSCCLQDEIVKVKNCSSYYVYELQWVHFNLRYCGNAGAGKLSWDRLHY